MTPPITVLPGALLLTGPALDALDYCLGVARAARRRNGMPESNGLHALTRALADAGQRDSSTTEPVDTEPIEHVTVTEAAQMLGCSTRTARRLAPRLGGRLLAGRWVLDHRAVTEHQEGTAA